MFPLNFQIYCIGHHATAPFKGLLDRNAKSAGPDDIRYVSIT